MTEPIPVVREAYWLGLLPQLAGSAFMAVLIRLMFPQALFAQALLVGVAEYWIVCLLLRRIFAREHYVAMAAYREQRYAEAVAHFAASRRFFEKHRKLDAWRSLIFGVASKKPYRVIALANMAYCYEQMGNVAKAIELYEQVLRESPDYSAARTSLEMLRSDRGVSETV